MITSETRGQVAEQIRHNRSFDRSTLMTVDRDKDEYIHFLGGLEGSLAHAKKLKKKWLDVGAGTTKGISELANSDIAIDFHIKATVLHRHQSTTKYLGNENTYITPVETLKPIPDASVSIITALNSAAYSVAPEMVIDSIDRVLEDKGIFHGTFQDPNHSHTLVPMFPPDEFEKYFKKKNYQTIIIKKPDDSTGVYILIAIKNGTTEEIRQVVDENLKSLQAKETMTALEMEIKKSYAVGLDYINSHSTENDYATLITLLKQRFNLSTKALSEVKKKLKERFSNQIR